MGIIIKRKKHLLTRFPLWLLVIAFLSFSPLIIGLIGAWYSEWSTGQPCNESNCSWMVLPWLTLISMPLGGLILLAYLIIVLMDSIDLYRKK